MRQSGSLTPQEMNKAVSLAAELLEQDIEHKSIIAATEEVGVPPEYMARAIERIHSLKVRKKTADLNRLRAGVAVICLAVLYWAVQSIARSMRTPVGDPARPKLIINAGELPTPVAQVPFSMGIDLTTQGMNEQYPTTLELHNNVGLTVQLYQLDAEGNRQLVTTLAPSGTIKENTWFSHPWLITDMDQNNLGVVYPAAAPSHVDLEPAKDLGVTGRQGYMLPLSLDDAHVVQANGPGPQTAIEFVNMSGEPLDLYRLSWDGKRERVATVEEGAAIFVQTCENDRWLADSGTVQETFKADLVPNTAIVRPLGPHRR